MRGRRMRGRRMRVGGAQKCRTRPEFLVKHISKKKIREFISTVNIAETEKILLNSFNVSSSSSLSKDKLSTAVFSVILATLPISSQGT